MRSGGYRSAASRAFGCGANARSHPRSVSIAITGRDTIAAEVVAAGVAAMAGGQATVDCGMMLRRCGELSNRLQNRSGTTNPSNPEVIAMPGQLAAEITVPNVKMSFDQLLGVIRQLDESGRTLIARVLLESRMDDELGQLLKELSATLPADDVTDAEIQAEVRAVRESRAR